MADRFWVGGTGNWEDTARWSLASGGAGGASVPTKDDDAIIDENSGAGGTISVTSKAAVVRDLLLRQTVLNFWNLSINRSAGVTCRDVAFSNQGYLNLQGDGRLRVTRAFSSVGQGNFSMLNVQSTIVGP